jgi:Tfp pilus assembly protein PilW
MKQTIRCELDAGFSLTEMLICILILIPVMGAAVGLFSVGANQQASEQSSVEVNQEARTAFEMMTTEIAQAGSHGDVSASLTAPVNGGSNPASVGATSGFTVGDYVTFDAGVAGKEETVQITAVETNSITASLGTVHDSGASVRLFALPYLTGMIPPTGLGANSSTTVSTLKFFGDINGNSNPQYIEYAYDSANSQITRSITPLSQANKNAALPFISNIKPNSVQFTLYTDNMGVVTAASIGLTVRNTWKTGSKYQESELFSRVSLPSAVAGSALLYEMQVYGGPNRLPATPPQVTSWASQQ